MDAKEINSLIKLLDDPDTEIFSHVTEKIKEYGPEVIAYLEKAWEESLDAQLQERIENLVHQLQFEHVKTDLQLWTLSGSFDLLQGILIINRYQYPDLDEQKIINQLEDIKREVWVQLMYDMSALEKVKLLNHVFFTIFGFGGNTKNYHDPQNSYLNQVLESKKGNQITLSIIYSTIAQKLDIPVYGINLPQHFILGYVDKAQEYDTQGGVLFYINPFNKGFVFYKRDINAFLQQLQLAPSAQFYEPCSNSDIAIRVLRNLISAYEKLGQPEKVRELEELLAVLIEK
ncbi:MAG: transglutaminase-like domain-containing protein [Sphingobacteriaceae bacterium]